MTVRSIVNVTGGILVARGVFVLAVLAASMLGCARTAPALVGSTPKGTPIIRISLGRSSSYLIKSQPPVLVDAGSPNDAEELAAALRKNGVSVADIGLVVITHGHGDHAGLARHIRDQSQARIVLGSGDLPLSSRGHNDELHPTSVVARILKVLASGDYPPFTPDIAVDEGSPLELKTITDIDGRVIAMPGHTPGSVVLVMDNHVAFVGDVMAGGSLGGLFSPHDPQDSYFHADPAENRQNIAKLLAMGVQTFYLGHGGPVSREDVARKLTNDPTSSLFAMRLGGGAGGAAASFGSRLGSVFDAGLHIGRRSPIGWSGALALRAGQGGFTAALMPVGGSLRVGDINFGAATGASTIPSGFNIAIPVTAWLELPLGTLHATLDGRLDYRPSGSRSAAYLQADVAEVGLAVRLRGDHTYWPRTFAGPYIRVALVDSGATALLLTAGLAFYGADK